MRIKNHLTYRKPRPNRKGVALLVAISVTAILFILVGGLMAALQFTEGRRGLDTTRARLLALQRLGIDSAQSMLSNEATPAATSTFEVESGRVELVEFRPADEQTDEMLYKDKHLELRQGDMVVRVVASLPYRGGRIAMDNTYLLNIRGSQGRRMCLRSDLLRSEGPELGPPQTSNSEE